jgi:alpha-mannosidase
MKLEINWTLRNVERRAFDLMACGFNRIIPIDTWSTESGSVVKLPFAVDTNPNKLYRFTVEITVPPPLSRDLRWFLKIVASGDARVIVDGVAVGGYDRGHTYLPIDSGKHRIDVIMSPRSMFGFHKWDLLFEKAFLVEVQWDAIRTGLRLLNLVEFVESLPPEDPLRKDLEKLLESIALELWVSPSIQQITVMNSFLYEGPLAPFAMRRDLRSPYANYIFIMGVYGIGILKGFLKEPEADYTSISSVSQVVRKTEKILYEALERLREKYGKNGMLYAIGHSHIDAAWLWPRAETIEKTLRTFSTMVSLAKEYDFVFVQSSAEYYEWVKERDRRLFDEIKKLIDRGKWVIVGGMWIESDVQIVDGESLARQFLYGQRYFLNTFGRLAIIGWIPDSFGFSGNLPQIMAKSGIEVYLTHKVIWMDTNEFPYHSFIWRGIDGTEMPTQVLLTSYNEMMTLHSIYRYWRSYKQKDSVPFLAYCYGYGDGGGGPTREMLEYIDLVNAMPNLPQLRNLVEAEYIDAVKRYVRSMPVWDGELYVEIHRGTYTTNIAVKNAMAEVEKRIIEAEMGATIAKLAKGVKIDKENIDRLWKLILFNQFHDILPGSSIKEVYDDALKDLETVVDVSPSIIESSIKSLASGDSGKSLALLSTVPWETRSVIKVPKELGVATDVECQEDVDGYHIYVATDSLGVKSYRLGAKECRASNGVETYEDSDGVVLKNRFLSLRVDWEGNISSLKLANDVEILREPAKLVAHIDKPGFSDAWDVTTEFLTQGVELKLLEKPRIVVKGPLVTCLEFAKGFESSKVIQRVCVYKDSPVVEIKSRLVWRNKGVLLKHWFRTTAKAEKAWYDIPFGAIERSTKMETSWEKARFEVPAVRWADISDGEKGLAIIAPSRHGYTAIRGDIGLSVIKSPTYPNPWSDLGDFEVTYYLYPHKGDYQKAEIPKIARETIFKPVAVIISGNIEDIKMVRVEPAKIIVTAFKPSEDGEGYILRLYNPYREGIDVEIELGFKASKVIETDIIELKKLTEIAKDIDKVKLYVKPFEIKTLFIKT